MKRVIICAIVAFGFTALPSFAYSPAVVTDDTWERDISGQVPNPCTGDLISFSGHELVNSHCVVNNNRVNLSRNGHCDYNGTDQNGNVYRIHTTIAAHDNAPLVNGTASINLVYRIHFVGQGNAPNFTLIQTGKITISAEGVVDPAYYDPTISCQ